MAKITKKCCNDRKSPFQLCWSENGKRYSRFFESEEARDEFLKQHDYLEKQSFEALMKLDDKTIRAIARIESERGNVTFIEMWEFWKKHHKAKRVVKLWDACNEYLLDMLENEKATMEHARHVRKILETLVEDLGDRNVDTITREELEDWLNELPYVPVTKKNYRSSMVAAWKWFLKHDIVEKNVASLTDCPDIEMGEIGILTVEETEKLFRANEKIDPEVCGLIALAMFAGMRSSAIPRIDYMANVKKDIKSSGGLANYGISPLGALPNLLGFSFSKFNRLPNNGEKLQGFIVYPSAIMVALAPITPTPNVMKQLSTYTTYTDPQTGLTLEYRAWGDADTDASKEIIECNYGFGVGESKALKRIVSE